MSGIIDSIQIANLVGPAIEGRESVIWDWLEVNQASFSILGDKETSVRVSTVKDIARLIHESDEKAVYWITDDNTELTGEVIKESSIPILDGIGDIDKNYDPEQIFKQRRNNFAQMYFEMFSQGKLGQAFKDVSMPISYRGHNEGPLHGYERMISNLTEYKDELQYALDQVKEVNWHKSNLGRKFIIDSSLNPYQQATAFTLAVWNFWSMICLMEEPQPFLLIIELPKSMVRSDQHDTPIRNTVLSILDTIKSISMEATVSYILSSETMFPIMEMGVRKQILLQTRDSDFDMFEDASRAFFGERIYEEWEKGHKEAGVLLDEFNRETTLISIKVKPYIEDNNEIVSDENNEHEDL